MGPGNLLALIVSDDANVLGPIKRTSEIDLHPSGLHQMQNEGGDESIVGAGDLRLDDAPEASKAARAASNIA